MEPETSLSEDMMQAIEEHRERRRRHTAWVQAWYKAHPEAYKKSGKHRPGYENKQYAEKRLALISLLGGKCSRCGEDDYRVLQINHLAGGGRKDVANYASPYAFYKAVLKGKRTSKDLNVLCRNCSILYEYEVGRRKAVFPLRLKVIQALGGKCVVCGNSDERVLEVNHVKGRVMPHYGLRDQLQLYKEVLGQEGSSEEVNIMCANCNMLYEYKRGKRRELR